MVFPVEADSRAAATESQPHSCCSQAKTTRWVSVSLARPRTNTPPDLAHQQATDRASHAFPHPAVPAYAPSACFPPPRSHIRARHTLQSPSVRTAIPRRLNDPLRGRIFHQNGSLIIHARINLRLESRGDRGYRQRTLVVHHPSHQVRPITSESNSAPAPFFTGSVSHSKNSGGTWISCGTLMPIHRNHFSDQPGLVLLLDQLPHLPVAAIPGGFIVDHRQESSRQPPSAECCAHPPY